MPVVRAISVPHSTAVVDTTGGQERLEHMYRAHHQVIWRTLRRMGCSPETAADFTQQAYLIALERLDQVYVGSEKAYLFAVAIGLAKTEHRKLRRVELTDQVELGSDEGRAAAHASDRQLALQLLDQVLASMDPDLVTVFTLYEMEGLASPEVAEILGIPLGTVASRLRRAREAFRAAAARIEAAPLRATYTIHPPHPGKETH